MLRTRFPGSRTTANATGRMLSSGPSFAKRCLNSAVFDWSCSLVRAEICGSKTLIRWTIGLIFFISRSLSEPKILLYRGSSIDEFNTTYLGDGRAHPSPKFWLKPSQVNREAGILWDSLPGRSSELRSEGAEQSCGRLCRRNQ